MEYTIREIFNKYGDKYLEKYKNSYQKLKVFNNIKTCKTKEQGIRIYRCSECGNKIYTYKACMDRHCPNCLDYKKELWIENKKEDILDIKYYHLVLCIPRELYPLFYYNQKTMYNLLFKISSEVVMELCLKYLSINIGITSILHTWSQKMKYYPHIHMLLTGGGINNLGKWIDSNLIDKDLIRKKFSDRLIKEIKKLRLSFYGNDIYLNNYDNYIKYLDNIKEESFICYMDKPYNSVNDIYEYFGKYAFRVCITNERIIKIDNDYVYFSYKDYYNKNINKVSRVKGEEFIRRFLLHTLDKSFVKIRYYGIMACKNKTSKMKKLRILTKTSKNIQKFLDKIEVLKKILFGKDITRCPKCSGKLYLYKEIYDNKSPPNNQYQGWLIDA